MKKEKKELPKYTLGEEIFNSVTHGVGALLAIAAFVLCVIFAIKNKDMIAVISAVIYGTMLIILYTMSTLYHSIPNKTAKKVFRIIDHCSIYLLIAGTYTPYSLVTLPRDPGLLILGVVWSVAILGIVLNAININKFRVVSFISYILLGWVIVFAFEPLLENLDTVGVWLLIAGGISYTVGTIFYKVGKKIKYMHSIFHLFVLAGSILHFFSILLYVYR